MKWACLLSTSSRWSGPSSKYSVMSFNVRQENWILSVFFCTFENDLILFSAAFWPILKKEVEQSQVRRHVGSGPDWYGIWTKGYYRGKRKVSHRVRDQHSSHIINHKLPYSCGKNNNSSILTLFRPSVETGTTNVSTYYLRKTLTRWRCQNKGIHTYTTMVTNIVISNPFALSILGTKS